MNAETRELIRRARDQHRREQLRKAPRLDVAPELLFVDCTATTNYGGRCPWPAEPALGLCAFHQHYRNDEEAEGDEDELDATLQQAVTKSRSSDLIGPERSEGPPFARAEQIHSQAPQAQDRGHAGNTPALCELSDSREAPDPALSLSTSAAVSRGRPRYEERRTA